MVNDYIQRLDPLKDKIFWSPFWSTLLAALPVLLLFWLLVPRRWLASKAGAAAALSAVFIAIVVYGMPWQLACMSFVYGSAFGLLPVGWTILNAMLLYNISVETGQFAIVRRSVAKLSGDARIQAVLIGFAFGAFLEGAAGAGTPVAICGAILVGLGFHPFQAAVLCLIANTSPVAYGGLGTPLIVLNGVTGLPTEVLSTMAGRQLPLISLVIPLYMVKCMTTWKQAFEIWPVLLVAGGSFSLFQFTFASFHVFVPGVVLYPMTDIGGGIFALLAVALFLRFWKPKTDWHFPADSEAHAEKRAAEPTAAEPVLTPRSMALAWTPFALMSIFLFGTGLIRQMEVSVKEGPGPVRIAGPVYTNYLIPVPLLDGATYRDARLREDQTAAHAERALFNFAWLTSPGTAVLFASLVSGLIMCMNRRQIWAVLGLTYRQMRVPIPTIVFMLGLSYVTRYSGMDATLGVAFAGTGAAYPFFAAILGWIGVFLTGTDAGSNALFGSLQKITATTIFHAPASLLASHHDLGQAQVLICTANSTGGVMGKMIDAQSICVATAATNQLGKEADLFKAVFWHSIFLACLVGTIVLLQAYVFPFTLMVPGP